MIKSVRCSSKAFNTLQPNDRNVSLQTIATAARLCQVSLRVSSSGKPTPHRPPASSQHSSPHATPLEVVHDLNQEVAVAHDDVHAVVEVGQANLQGGGGVGGAGQGSNRAHRMLSRHAPTCTATMVYVDWPGTKQVDTSEVLNLIITIIIRSYCLLAS